MLIKLQPLADAVKKINAKTPVGAALRSSEWARIPLALRERAQFSARVTSARLLAGIQDKVEKRMGMLREQVAHGGAGIDRASFIADLRRIAYDEGLSTATGRITDVSSAARLGLIFDVQTEQAAEFAKWKAGQDQTALDNFPAQELLRVEDREQPRNWISRWTAAGGQIYGGRMIALKDDPIWSAISRFGTPYPPFDFGSGMGVEDVSREEAIALGVIAPDQHVAPVIEDFNARLDASVRGLPPKYIERLKQQFGDQIQLKDDRVVWQGNIIGDLVEKVAGGAKTKEWINLGLSTARAKEKAAAHMDITGYRLDMRADDIKHIISNHGVENEKRRDQQPVTKLDFELVPHLWRDPDDVRPGKKPRSLTFYKKLNGTLVMVEYQKDSKQKVFWVNTMYVKKE